MYATEIKNFKKGIKESNNQMGKKKPTLVKFKYLFGNREMFFWS